jgi:hypothetical protein
MTACPVRKMPFCLALCLLKTKSSPRQPGTTQFEIDVSAGTERQDVSNDYAQRISEGHVEVEAGVALSLRKLAGIPPAAEVGHCNCNAAGNCLNLSMCAFTTAAESFTVMAWNTQGQNVSSWLRVPVTGANYTVTDLATKDVLLSQVRPTLFRYCPCLTSRACLGKFSFFCDYHC